MTRITTLTVVLILVFSACGGVAPTTQQKNPQTTDISIDTFVLLNQGGNMEGHTPRGFEGMGTGLFAGDNLNPRFPEGDGVQIFLTFDLTEISQDTVISAVLQSEHAHVIGTPFLDLGDLRAEEIRYAVFSSALWNLEASGISCVFANTADGPFACDLTQAVQRALDDGRTSVQFRLLFDKAGDGDGIQDLVMFFIADSNTNEPGIFVLEVELAPAESS